MLKVIYLLHFKGSQLVLCFSFVVKDAKRWNMFAVKIIQMNKPKLVLIYEKKNLRFAIIIFCHAVFATVTLRKNNGCRFRQNQNYCSYVQKSCSLGLIASEMVSLQDKSATTYSQLRSSKRL